MKLALVLAAASLLGPKTAVAERDATPPPLEYYVVESRLDDLLEMIGRDAELPLELDGGDAVFVTATTLTGTTDHILDELARGYDLYRFAFSGKTYMGAAADQKSRLLRSEDYSREEMLDALKESGLDLSRYQVAPLSDPNAFILTAPPRLIAIVETIVDSLPRKREASNARGVILRRGVTISDTRME